MRMKNLPPVGSEEYWWEETMFAPRSNRKPDTAATMPGRSAQPISRRAVKRGVSFSIETSTTLPTDTTLL